MNPSKVNKYRITVERDGTRVEEREGHNFVTPLAVTYFSAQFTAGGTDRALTVFLRDRHDPLTSYVGSNPPTSGRMGSAVRETGTSVREGDYMVRTQFFKVPIVNNFELKGLQFQMSMGGITDTGYTSNGVISAAEVDGIELLNGDTVHIEYEYHVYAPLSGVISAEDPLFQMIDEGVMVFEFQDVDGSVVGTETRNFQLFHSRYVANNIRSFLSHPDNTQGVFPWDRGDVTCTSFGNGITRDKTPTDGTDTVAFSPDLVTGFSLLGSLRDNYTISFRGSELVPSFLKTSSDYSASYGAPRAGLSLGLSGRKEFSVRVAVASDSTSFEAQSFLLPGIFARSSHRSYAISDLGKYASQIQGLTPSGLLSATCDLFDGPSFMLDAHALLLLNLDAPVEVPADHRATFVVQVGKTTEPPQEWASLGVLPPPPLEESPLFPPANFSKAKLKGANGEAGSLGAWTTGIDGNGSLLPGNIFLAAYSSNYSLSGYYLERISASTPRAGKAVLFLDHPESVEGKRVFLGLKVRGSSNQTETFTVRGHDVPLSWQPDGTPFPSGLPSSSYEGVVLDTRHLSLYTDSHTGTYQGRVLVTFLLDVPVGMKSLSLTYDRSSATSGDGDIYDIELWIEGD